MDNTADDRYVPRDALNGQRAKAAGLDACVTHQATRIAQYERFCEVMTDTLERATAFLRDRAEDGVTDEDDDALLRECELVLEWARQVARKRLVKS